MISKFEGKKFVSMDPSMRNTALVWGTIVDGEILPEDFTVIKTVRNKKLKVAEDTVSRAGQVLLGIGDVLESVAPNYCFAEYPSGSQSSRAAVSYGVSCAYIAYLSYWAICVTPTEVKKFVTGNKNATKEDIISWAEEMYPNFPFPRNKKGIIIKATGEHICDALAIAYTGFNKNK